MAAILSRVQSINDTACHLHSTLTAMDIKVGVNGYVDMMFVIIDDCPFGIV